MSTVVKKLFSVFDKEEATDLVAEHYPQGRAWDLKNDPDSNLRKYLHGSAALVRAFQEQIAHLMQEFDINQTVDLLPEWETSVGLPNECYCPNASIEQRREDVKFRLSRRSLVSLQEIQDFVSTFFPDIVITLYPAMEYFAYGHRQYEAPFGGNDTLRFVLVVEIEANIESYEYEYEHLFDAGYDKTRLECLLREIIPANCALYFRFLYKPIPKKEYLTASNGTVLTASNGLPLQASNQI
jgi:uncharacterized protein YmfQ (DUF2313 family)